MASLRRHNNGTRHRSNEMLSQDKQLHMGVSRHVGDKYVFSLTGEASSSDHHYTMELTGDEAVRLVKYVARMLTVDWQDLRNRESDAQCLANFANKFCP